MKTIFRKAVATGLVWVSFALIVAMCACHDSEKRNSTETAQTTAQPAAAPTTTENSSVDNKADNAVPPGAQTLISCYPDFVKGYRDGKLVMADGSTIVYDDGRKKSFVQLLDEADPEDMFAFKYDRNSWVPGERHDAGRSRCEALFKKMYGNSAAEVQRHLVSVPWFGGNVKFTTVNGADKHLRAVYAELQKHPELHKYLKSSGTFYWRQVRGAKRLSAHSYGMTIDLGVEYSDYWQWAGHTTNEMARVPYKNKFPHEIVEIFERHGFIWGGRWYHYDTMHFEYRPEILRG